MNRLWIVLGVITGIVVGCQGPTMQQTNLNRLAAVEAGTGVLMSGALAYASLPVCPPNTSITVQNPCHDRVGVAALSKAALAVNSTQLAAHAWIDANPTLSADAVISALQTAIATYSQVAAQYGVK